MPVAPAAPRGYLRYMRKACILAALLSASALAGQSVPPKAATLTWSDLRILIAPEFGETMLWLSADATLTRKGASRNFFGALDPATTVAWVQGSREFLRQPLGSRDTGDTRSSVVLTTKNGKQLFLVRRRYKGEWTHERYLGFSNGTDSSLTLVDIDPFRTRDLLDSLEAVAKRTPASASSSPRSAWLTWKNLNVAIAPDSGGTYLWADTRDDRSSSRNEEPFGSAFDPAMVLSWADSARAFLALRLTAEDPGPFRASRRLPSFSGDGIYIERRQVNGAWSQDRYIVMESQGSPAPLVISGDESTIGSIIDSLEAIARRTPIMEAVVQRDSSERANNPRPTKHATARQDNQPPAYPEVERGVGRSGSVLVSFVVGPEGRADTTTVNVLHASSYGFRKAVLDALPALRFHPAERNGRAVRERVVMPFMFAVIR